jgi:AcrR family transcriptional regulator
MSDSQRDPTAQPRWRRDARENRRRLLAAAKELFAARGTEATSMSEIARAAEVGQGTLYRHFADKGELCHALIREDLAAFQERVGPVVSGAWALASPLARLDTLIAEKVRLTESHLALFAAMEDAVAGSRRTKPFRGPFHTWLHEQISALLGEAAALGEVAPLDVAITADSILAATSPSLYRYQRYDLGYSSERITAAVRALFVERLRRDPAITTPRAPRGGSEGRSRSEKTE